jgi:hypothetical protein
MTHLIIHVVFSKQWKMQRVTGAGGLGYTDNGEVILLKVHIFDFLSDLDPMLSMKTTAV